MSQQYTQSLLNGLITLSQKEQLMDANDNRTNVEWWAETDVDYIENAISIPIENQNGEPFIPLNLEDTKVRGKNLRDRFVFMSKFMSSKM